MSSLRKNVASQHIGFCLNNLTTGAPVTAGGAGTVVIDGGAQASCAGTFTHKGTGQWDYAPTQAETNGTNVSFAFTGTSAIQVGMTFYTIGYDPTVANLPANTTQLAGQTVTAGAGVTFPSSVASPTNITAGTITTVTNLTNAPTAGDLTATMKTSVTTAATAATPTVAAVTGNVGGNVVGSVGSVVGAVGSVTGAVGSVTGNVGGNVSGSVGSVLAGVTVSGSVTVGTNNDKTGYSLTSGERTSIADTILDRDMAAGVDSGTATVRTMRQALRFLRNKWAIVTGTLTVYKEDDTTASWTGVVGTDATAAPITSNDPAGP